MERGKRRHGTPHNPQSLPLGCPFPGRVNLPTTANQTQGVLQSEPQKSSPPQLWKQQQSEDHTGQQPCKSQYQGRTNLGTRHTLSIPLSK